MDLNQQISTPRVSGSVAYMISAAISLIIILLATLNWFGVNLEGIYSDNPLYDFGAFPLWMVGLISSIISIRKNPGRTKGQSVLFLIVMILGPVVALLGYVYYNPFDF